MELKEWIEKCKKETIVDAFYSHNFKDTFIRIFDNKNIRKEIKESIESVKENDLELEDGIDFIMGTIRDIISEEKFEILKHDVNVSGDESQ